MSLELRNVSKLVGNEVHISPTDLTLEDEGFNILLGTTLAGKTTLMQLMAGLNRPSTGEVRFRGKDVTGVAVQKRNVSMVYQQFINYPNFNVFENIASPLRVAGLAEAEIKRRVHAVSDLLRLSPMLQRRPSELSGGQQQRTALARALVKDADLVLLDEPLANLDFKLREELRDELPKLLSGRGCTVVYATTEPSEALLLGGHTAALEKGRVMQFGETGKVYRDPDNLQSAAIFSEPPINRMKVRKTGGFFTILDDVNWPVPKSLRTVPDGEYTLALRPHNVTIARRGESDATLAGQVLVTEISGSESVIHFEMQRVTWVSQSHGVHRLGIGSIGKFFADLNQAMLFAADGTRVRGEGSEMARIKLTDLAHTYGNRADPEPEWAVKRVNLEWADGGAFALLGPSGCGKTTLLNIMSGLIRPTEGMISFGDRDVTDLSPEDRNIAQVFQFPVVYDTMTVYDNIAFPLRNRGMNEAEIAPRVAEIAELTELTPLLKQRASGLTADGKQKISLARGLVRPDVNLVMFDEPLTVIDPHLKWILRSKLRELHQRVGTTMIYVTHDQTEALTFADQVVVMNAGEVVQIGTPVDLFERPQHTFVGHFIGSPGMNVLPAQIEHGHASFAGQRIEVVNPIASAAGRIELGIRPEFVHFAREGIPATITSVADAGRFRIVDTMSSGHRIKLLVDEGGEIPAINAHLRFDPLQTRLYRDGWLATAGGAS